MEKKSLLAVVLSAAVFIIYYGFIYKPPPPPAKAPLSSTGTTQPETLPSASGGPSAATPAKAAPSVAKRPNVLSEIETKLLRTEISSDNGLPQHWWLTKYFIQPNNKGPNIDLLQEIEGQQGLGLLLYPGGSPLYPQYELGEKTDHSVNYHAQLDTLALEQSLDFSPQAYSVEIKLSVENRSSSPQTLSPGLRLANVQTPPSQRGFLIFKEAPNFKTPFYMLANKVKRFPAVQKLGTRSEEVGEIPWVGLSDRYFLRIILARNVSSQNRVAYGKEGDEIYAEFQYAPDTLAAGQKKDYQFTLYLGPKEPDLLKGFGDAHLEKAIDYGWFSVVALPILYSLKLFESFLGNWGLSIIALTIVIKLLLQPLTRKSMKSMKAMQELQPQLQKIREKYADDRERLNLETMSLFKTHKVNPMGGCLPMVLQMPIYIALYKVLYNATDLYHAPFFWFYHDLSAPDPYYVLPILLGIFMVLQQKMTPSTVDPSQARMMMFMPLMFSAFMLFLPVGLVLYIFVNTLMTVAQQYMNQRDISFLDLFRRGKKT
jgi:YidC/Oxa1 family membrane protein insertase